MGLQKYPLGGFLGGMNLVDNPYALHNNEAQIAKNVDLGLRDILSSRKGFSEAGLAGVVSSQKKFPSKITEEEIEGNPDPWTNIANAKLEDGVFATEKKVLYDGIVGHAALTSQPIDPKLVKGEEFKFSLPANAVPLGVVMGMRGSSIQVELTSFNKELSLMQLLKAGVAAGLAQPGGDFTPVLENHSAGGPENLVGTTLTKAEVEAVGFGMTFQFRGTAVNKTLPEVGSPRSIEIRLDDLYMEVYYFVPGVGTDAIAHMRPWYTGANHYLMLSANGKIKRLKEGTLTTLFTGTPGTTWYFEPIEYQAGNEEILLCLNGIDAPKYINQAGEAKEWKGATKVVPKGTMGRVWKGRMMIAGVAAHPQRLYESEPFNPFTPDDETNGGYGTNYVDIGTGEDDVDPITWLEVIDDVLLVFKKKSTWAIYTDAGMANYRIANVGCEGRFLSAVLDDRCYFANRYGVYSVTAEGNPRYESYNLEPLFKGESTSLFEGVDLEKLGTMGRMGVLPTGRVFLACSPINQLANSYLFEAYPRLRGSSSSRRGNDERTPWVIDQFNGRAVTSICSYRLKDKEPDKMVAGLIDSSTGSAPELVTLFTGSRDGLAPIEWKWRSGQKAEISEEPFERIRRANLLMKGKVKAKVVSGTQVSATATLESAEESMQRFRPETWGRYHYLELWEEGPIATSIYAAELAFRGGKEHT